MPKENTFIVDFVAVGEAHDEWKMVLVEEGNWSGDRTTHLYRIQNRLYECLDAALDGQLAEKYPESKGKKIIIQLDCYDAPKNEIEDFFIDFSEMVMSIPDYREALENTKFIKDIAFKITFDNAKGVIH